MVMKWMVNHMVTRSWKHDELMRELPDALKYARIIAYNANHGDYADEFQSDVQRKAFQYLDSFKQGNMAAWLRTIVSNCWIDILKKHRNDPYQYPVDEQGNMLPDVEEKAGAVPSPENYWIDVYDTMKSHDDIMKALAGLKKDYAKTLIMYAGDMSYRQIAERTGVSIGTVMSRLSRARKYMREHMPETYAHNRALNQYRNSYVEQKRK